MAEVAGDAKIGNRSRRRVGGERAGGGGGAVAAAVIKNRQMKMRKRRIRMLKNKCKNKNLPMSMFTGLAHTRLPDSV